MNILIPIIFFIALFKVRVRKTQENVSTLNVKQTAGINGVFVLLIFIRHFQQYVVVGKYDKLVIKGQGILGQLIVVSFMFFSGYAFIKQLQKDERYVKKLPRKIITIYGMFVLTVLAFLLVQTIMGQKYQIKHIFLSFTGLRSLGNSTWYVIAIIFMWVFSFIVYSQNRMNKNALFGAFIALYVIIFYTIKEPVWYNTVIAYYAGILFAENEDKYRGWINKKGNYIKASAITVIILICGVFTRSILLLFELWVLAFCAFFVLISEKLQFGNKISFWLSKYALEIYLIQRIPMIILQNRINSNVIYVIICMAVTFVLALLWKQIYKVICRILVKWWS